MSLISKRGVIAALLAASASLWWPVASAGALDDARALINEGRYGRALAVLDRHLKENPQDAEARFSRGLVLVKMSRTDEAIQVFADITRDFPQLPEPYNNLAVLYAQRGDYERARDALEAALSTHPSYATAHENLGDVYTALATAAYNRALVLDRNNEAIRVKLNLLNKLDSGTPVATASTEVPTAPVAETRPPTPVATAEPEPAAADIPTQPAFDRGEITEQITRTLFGWASAWSNQNIDGYLDAYHSQFDPEDGRTRAEWADSRRDRLRAPETINVRLIEPSVEVMSEQRAQVRFIQVYESDTYSDRVEKVLEMRPEAGGWKITRETVTETL